nr:phosphatase PAP2 family protein [uncultured Pseudodesulfovibrio sp.]
MFFSTLPVDLNLFLLINQHWRLGLFDTIMPILSSMPALLALLGIALAWAISKGGKKQIIYFLILFAGMGLADFSTKIIKDEVHRVRPLNAIAGTYYVEDGEWRNRPSNFVQTKERGTSYPSAHCANTMSLALLSLLLWPSLKKWPLFLPLAVGYSRVYLGKHYPTDVLAGWLTGVIVAGIVWLLWKELKRRYMPPDPS